MRDYSIIATDPFCYRVYCLHVLECKSRDGAVSRALDWITETSGSSRENIDVVEVSSGRNAENVEERAETLALDSVTGCYGVDEGFTLTVSMVEPVRDIAGDALKDLKRSGMRGKMLDAFRDAAFEEYQQDSSAFAALARRIQEAM